MSFPAQYGRTGRFTFGASHSHSISADGLGVVFLRSRAGDDPVTCLWDLDVATGAERCVVDPAELPEPDGDGEDRWTPREQGRRVATGITDYSLDGAGSAAVFALGTSLFHVDIRSAAVRRLAAEPGAARPQLDPLGRHVAYCSGPSLRLYDLATGTDRPLATGGDTVSWGRAEYVAVEEMGRAAGMWWSPEGACLLAARVDEAPVSRAYLLDPTDPGQPPTELRYPFTGSANADVTLAVFDVDGVVVPVRWDRDSHPYLVRADWSSARPLVAVQSRDQRSVEALRVDAGSGSTTVIERRVDPCWVELTRGVPACDARGNLVWTADVDDTRRLTVAGEPVTPVGLQVTEVLDIDGETVLFAGGEESTETCLWTVGPAGLRRLDKAGSVATGRMRAGTLLRYVRDLREVHGQTVVQPAAGPARPVRSLVEVPDCPPPRVELMVAGARRIRTAVLWPSWHRRGSGPLPVLMDPYGGPHGRRVLAALDTYLVPQWFAEQGFAVVIADGRGTPGRGPAWERAVHGDLAGPVLEDQQVALEAAAERFPDLDLARVGIRGWSFGGYLAALAVLRRPDLFHAAVAGAPVTDWRLYDTHYTERYLGDPVRNEQVYARSSLLESAADLTRPLLIVHGTSDGNVLPAHSYRLSQRLLAAGRPHSFLPLPGVTHVATGAELTGSLLPLQANFLLSALDRGDHAIVDRPASTLIT